MGAAIVRVRLNEIRSGDAEIAGKTADFIGVNLDDLPMATSPADAAGEIERRLPGEPCSSFPRMLFHTNFSLATPLYHSSSHSQVCQVAGLLASQYSPLVGDSFDK